MTKSKSKTGSQKGSEKVSDKYVKGMSKEDIYEKIDVLKTENSKINYLKSLEKKSSLMKPSTRKAFFEILGENYEGEDSFEDAAKYYKKAGVGKEKWKNLGDKALEEEKFGYALEYYEKAGDKEKAKETWIKKGDKALEEEKFDSAVGCYKKAGVNGNAIVADKFFENGNFTEAAEYYEKAGKPLKAKKSKILLADIIAKELTNSAEETCKRFKYNEEGKINYWNKRDGARMKQRLRGICLSIGGEEGFEKYAKTMEEVVKKGRFSIDEKEEEMKDTINLFHALEKDIKNPGKYTKDYLEHYGDSFDRRRANENLDAAKYYEKAGNMEKVNLALADYVKAKIMQEISAKYDEHTTNWGYPWRWENIKGALTLVGELSKRMGKKNKEELYKKLVEEFEDLPRQDRRSGGKEQEKILIDLYEKAGSKEKLISLGDKEKRNGNESKADELYKKAGLKNGRGFEEVGDSFLSKGKFNDAIYFYEKAGVGKEKWKNLGDKALEEEKFGYALEYYEKAGDKKGLMKAGDKALKEGKFGIAVDAYEKAGLDKTESLPNLVKMKEAYSKLGKGVEEMNLAKKVKSLQDRNTKRETKQKERKANRSPSLKARYRLGRSKLKKLLNNSQKHLK